MTSAITAQPAQPPVLHSDFASLQQMLGDLLKTESKQRSASQEKEILDLVGKITTENAKEASKLAELAILLITAGVPGIEQYYDSDSYFIVDVDRKAQDLLIKSLMLNPDNPDALAYLARIVIGRDRLVKELLSRLQLLPFGITDKDNAETISTTLLSRALERDKNHVVATILRASIALGKAEYHDMPNLDAVATMRRILAIDPNNIFALDVLGRHLEVQNQYSYIAKAMIEKGEDTSIPERGIVSVFDYRVDYAAKRLTPEQRETNIKLHDEGVDMRERAYTLLSGMNLPS